jgi:hypothetical protein
MSNIKPDLQIVPGDPTATVPDPFDLSTLALSQDYMAAAGLSVKKLLTRVPVRKPSAQDFVRVHPGADYRTNILCVDLKDDRETYAVRPEVAPELVGETILKTIYTAINKQGVVFLWPCSLPGPDGRDMTWWKSAREAAELAMTRWIRMRADMSLGGYQLYEAGGELTEPTWPEVSFQELIKIAFKDLLIDRIDHPVIRRLRGMP